MESHEAVIKTFLLQEMMFERDESLLSEDAPLLEKGIIDSLGIQQLVTFLQAKFNVIIPDEEVIPENFESIRSISNLVERIRNV
ncbi:MAG: acyl carrier protein [bacterium]